MERHYKFEETDAWLDLWCHTTVNDPRNAFSFMAPTVQFGKYGVILSLESLGRRWGWEKTKVWRFFQMHREEFALRRLPGNLGCLVFNLAYPCKTVTVIPSVEEISALLGELRRLGRARSFDRVTLNRVIAWYSRHAGIVNQPQKSRVALSYNIYRAYLSPVKDSTAYRYDCRGIRIEEAQKTFVIEALRSPPPGFTGFVWLTPEDFVKRKPAV